MVQIEYISNNNINNIFFVKSTLDKLKKKFSISKILVKNRYKYSCGRFP